LRRSAPLSFALVSFASRRSAPRRSTRRSRFCARHSFQTAAKRLHHETLPSVRPPCESPAGGPFSVAAPPAADHKPQRSQRPNGADDVVKGSARRMRRQPGRSPLSAGATGNTDREDGERLLHRADADAELGGDRRPGGYGAVWWTAENTTGPWHAAADCEALKKKSGLSGMSPRQARQFICMFDKVTMNAATGKDPNARFGSFRLIASRNARTWSRPSPDTGRPAACRFPGRPAIRRRNTAR
jgi:hypothetical protein